MPFKKHKASITGVHGYVPDYVLTNSELETLVDTTNEWIITRTGIKERRILKGDMKASILVIEEGASFNGLCGMDCSQIKNKKVANLNEGKK